MYSDYPISQASYVTTTSSSNGHNRKHLIISVIIILLLSAGFILFVQNGQFEKAILSFSQSVRGSQGDGIQVPTADRQVALVDTPAYQRILDRVEELESNFIELDNKISLIEVVDTETDENGTVSYLNYNLLSGSGISVLSGNAFTISNTGVLSFKGLTGAVDFIEGENMTISVDGNVITLKSNDTDSKLSEVEVEAYAFDGDNGGLFTDLAIVGGRLSIDANGNLTKINNVTYSWPSSQAAGSGYVLKNDGSGNLSWGIDSTGGGGSLWTQNGSDIYYNAGNVGIGTTTPSFKLELAGTNISDRKIGINGTQVMYLPDQTDFVGTMIIGNGGGSLTHSSGIQGQNNILMGIDAGLSLTTGYNNFALGTNALKNNTTGNYNTAIGYNSLTSNISGGNNVAIGEYSMLSNTTGNFNVAVGVQALEKNLAGADNVAIGLHALKNYTGSNNTAVGRNAMLYTTTGSSNVAIGLNSIVLNTTGVENAALGVGSLYSNTTGSYNSAFGRASLSGITTGTYNTGVGYRAGNYLADGSTVNQISTNSVYLGTLTKALSAGSDNEIVIGYNTIGNGSNTVTLGNDSIIETILKGDVGIGTSSPDDPLDVVGAIDASTEYKLGNATILDVVNTDSLLIGHLVGGSTVGQYNTFVGYDIGLNIDGANDNSAFGHQALKSLTTGYGNIGVGAEALKLNSTGPYNVALGVRALSSSTNAGWNTAIGYEALRNATSSENTAIGYYAGGNLTTGYNNTFIGNETGNGITTGFYNVVLGYNSGGSNISRSIVIGSSAYATADNQLILGGYNTPVNDVYFGSGVTDFNGSSDVTLQLTGGWGTNKTGGSLTLASGKATGNAAGGNIYFDTSDAGASGMTLQSLSTKMTILNGGNVGIGDTTPDAKLDVNGTILVENQGSDPTGVADHAGIFAKDVSSSSELFALDEAGNVTQLSPHNPENGQWWFNSTNVNTGRKFVVDMEGLIKKADIFFGGGYVYENDQRVYSGNFIPDTINSNISNQQQFISSLEKKLSDTKTQISTLLADMKTVKGDIQSSKKTHYELVSRVEFLEDMIGLESSQSDVLGETDINVATQSADIARSITDTEIFIDKNIVAEKDLIVLGKANISELAVTGSINNGMLSVNGLDCDEENICSVTLSTLTAPLRIQPDALGDVEFMAGKIKINTDGNIEIQGSVTAQKINVVSEESDNASIGVAKISANEDEVIIPTTAVTDGSRIFVTATSPLQSGIYVSEKTAGDSFKVKLTSSQETEVTFDWWVVN